MIGIVQMALDHHAAGHTDAAQQVLDSISPGGRWQVELCFGEIAAICRHRIETRQESRPGTRCRGRRANTVGAGACLRRRGSGTR